MNVLTLTGRLDSDPTRRETTRGVVDGRPRLYLTVQTWGHLAGRCAQHLFAGRHVAVVGALCHEHWINRSGERAERWYAKASAVSFLDRPSDVDDETVDLASTMDGGR